MKFDDDIVETFNKGYVWTPTQIAYNYNTCINILLTYFTNDE